MQTKLLIFKLIVICSGTSFTQIDSTLSFFPLHSRDLFHYKYLIPADCGRTDTSYITMEIFDDTLLSTNYLYKKVQYYYSYNNLHTIGFYRVDTSTFSVFQYTGNPPYDQMIEKLDVKLGETFVRENWRNTECISVDTLYVLGLKTIVKKFQVYYSPGASYSLANGLGCINYSVNTTDPCYPNSFTPIIRKLVYARINGTEYGNPVVVNVKKDPLQSFFELEQNYPNPFNPGTSIKYSLSKESYVLLSIYNIVGEEIEILVSNKQAAGIYEVRWNAEDCPSGIYFYQLKTDNGYIETKKMMILK